jgi:hypothetical protein
MNVEKYALTVPLPAEELAANIPYEDIAEQIEFVMFALEAVKLHPVVEPLILALSKLTLPVTFVNDNPVVTFCMRTLSTSRLTPFVMLKPADVEFIMPIPVKEMLLELLMEITVPLLFVKFALPILELITFVKLKAVVEFITFISDAKKPVIFVRLMPVAVEFIMFTPVRERLATF